MSKQPLVDTYAGISEQRVEELRERVAKDLHAADAAEELIGHISFCIAADVRLPNQLRDILCDMLEQTDPLSMFRHVLPLKKKGRGRPRKESDREWMELLAEIVELYRDGYPLVHPDDCNNAIQRTDGTAFQEYAERHTEGNEVAMRKEARRIQSGFWNHLKRLPAAQFVALGLGEFLPRNN